TGSSFCPHGLGIWDTETCVRLRYGAQDAAKQAAGDRPISKGRNRLARLDQSGITLHVEHRTAVARRSHPLRKAVGRDRVHLEVHVGKAVAAEIRRHSTLAS